MRFERRDLLLAFGCLFLMVGLMPFAGAAASAAIAVAAYFGIRVAVGRRRRAMLRQAGEGLCMECGGPVSGGRCPACDRASDA